MAQIRAQSDFVVARVRPIGYGNFIAGAPDSMIDRPDTVRHVVHYADVVSVGLGRETEFGGVVTPIVEVGDVVLYDVRQAIPFEYEGTVHVIMRSHEVLAVLEDAPEMGDSPSVMVARSLVTPEVVL